MKQRISPATAISLVALFFSLTGAGFAASRYIVTSKSQIKPSVLRALRGEQGPRGLTGVPGPQGATGATGAQGPAGSNAAIDWSHVYLATDDQQLTTDAPNADAHAFCHAGDHVLTGGFQGFAEITTISEIMPAAYSPDGAFHAFGEWLAGAHLDPNLHSNGWVRAWALCTSS